MNDIYPLQIADDLDTGDLWEAVNLRITQTRAICEALVLADSENRLRQALLAAYDLLQQAEGLHNKLYDVMRNSAKGGQL